MKQPEKYFLYVGNAYPHKNLERSMEAFGSLKVSGSQGLKLLLVGPDDYFYKKLKEKVQKMGLSDQVIFHGPATKEELTDLYKNALALVFPSLMEGFGLPGIEAMANCCPVLCSDIPVFHEIYGEAAIYFNPLDINDIKNKIEQFGYHDFFSAKQKTSDFPENRVNHESRNDLVKRGFEQAKKHSWKKLAKETLQVYLGVKND